MRVTTDIWVSAIVRRVFASGGFAAVIKRGAMEAGAIFLLSRSRLGEVTLHGPAPQTAYDQARPDDRIFIELESAGQPEAIEKRLEREQRFDPDIWIVEVEPGAVPLEELFVVTKP